jgi:hypothetical protein
VITKVEKQLYPYIHIISIHTMAEKRRRRSIKTIKGVKNNKKKQNTFTETNTAAAVIKKKKKKKINTRKKTVEHKNDEVKTKRLAKPLYIKKKLFIQEESSIDNTNKVPVCFVCRKIFQENEVKYSCKQCRAKPNHFTCLRDHPRFGLIHQDCIQDNITSGNNWLKKSLQLGTTEYY